MKAYAVTSRERFAGAPDIPTAAEAGLPGFESEFWIGVLTPGRTPPALVDRLNREMVAILRSPELHAALIVQGAEPMASTSQEFAAFIRSETVKWGQVIKTAGIKPE